MSPSVSIRLLLAQSDARLVELARAGHERAFEALVLRYRRPLLGYCRRLLLREERAEEAMQHGLLQAWLALREGTEVREVKPWLYRIVHNSALNMLRVSGYDYASLSDTLRGSEAPQDDLDRRITIREAFAGLAALPEMQREALLRTAVEGRSHEEVARALGLSEGALRGLVYRARVSLRAAATALTPPPIVNWAISHRAAMSAPLTTRVAELATSGGSVGVSGLLLKGSAVVVSAGALAGSISAVHHHQHPKPQARLLITHGSPIPPATADAATSSLPAPPSSAASRARFNAAAVRRHGPASPSARALLGVEAGLQRSAGGDPGFAARPDSRAQQPDGQPREDQPTPASGDLHESSHQGDTGTGGAGSGSISNDGLSASGSSDKSGSSSSGTGSSTGSSGSGSGTSSTSDSSSPSGSGDKLSFSGEADGGLVNEPTGDGGSSTDGSNSTSSGSSSPEGGSSSLSN